MKTPAAVCGVLISKRALFGAVVGKKEQTRAGQCPLDSLPQECSTCWEIYVHVWKLLSNTESGDLSCKQI